MTELLNAEFVDETGTTRHLTREELLTYLNVVAGAGNETTTRLIGWAGKVLAEHPDQRRELVENPALIPQAVEELLRFEPPAPHVARYVTRNVEYLRTDRARGQRDDDADRRRRAGPSPVPARRRRFRHPPRGSVSTSHSASARTTASDRRWPGSRAASLSRRSSSGSPNGMST